jgi:hypothetical protein
VEPAADPGRRGEPGDDRRGRDRCGNGLRRRGFTRADEQSQDEEQT